MTAGLARGGSRRRRPPPPTGEGGVADLVRARIERAIARRSRYKYVQARVEREGPAWKIVSPNCSRKVDPQGGDIDIACFVPDEQGLWRLQSRDHAQACWRTAEDGLTLQAALERVCEDPLRIFWP